MKKIVISIILGTVVLAGCGAASSNNLYAVESISHGHGLAVDVADSNKLYVATHYGLYTLINEKDLYQIGKKKDDYMGFSVHPTNPNIFFSSGHPATGGNIGFQKSEDGGFTWKKISNGIDGPVDFHAMAVSPVDPNFIYGWYRGNLQRSTDQGNTWEIISKNLQIISLAVDTQDENIVYAATPSGVAVSKDKGGMWTPLSKDLEGGAVTVLAQEPSNVKVMLAFSEKLGGLGKSADGGITWKKMDENFGGDIILYMAFDKQNPLIVYALTRNNELYKSSDGGTIWLKILL